MILIFLDADNLSNLDRCLPGHIYKKKNEWIPLKHLSRRSFFSLRESLLVLELSNYLYLAV